MAGIKPEEAMGNGWLNMVHPKDRKRILREWKNAVSKKRVSKIEFRFKTAKGKITHVYGQAVPDYNENKQLVGFVGSVTDITDHVLAEQSLAESEQRNSVLLNAIPDLIFRLSKNGTYLDYKAASDFKTLVPPEVFLGKKVKEVLPAPVANLCMKNIRKALKTNTIQTFSYSLPDMADNSKVNYFEGRIVAYDNNEVLAVIRDITQQREAGLLLKESEEKWRSLVKSAPQYIVTIDKNNRVTFINHLRLLKPEQIMGKSVFELLKSSQINKKDFGKLLDDARNNKRHSIEFSVINPLGETMWFNVKAAPVKPTRKADELIIMALDITDRKKAEEAIHLSNKKLKVLYQRLETIREEEKKNIAREIHDELGQELTAIKLGMFWLQKYFDRKNEKPDIRQVQQKVESLIELSTQTISSARKLAHQLRPIVLDNLGLIPAIEWQVEKLNESGNVVCSLRSNTGNEKFSKEFSVALFRIIQESLTNILRHSKATKASLDLHIKNKELVLKIEDNGIGIRQSDMKKAGKIGIFGMKERIQTWHGRFVISGKPRKGTKLKVIFPLIKILG